MTEEEKSAGSSQVSVETVRRFLAALEARDLAAAKQYLDAGFEMVFPGDRCFSTLEQLLAWAAPRYRRIAKTIEGMDSAPAAGGCIVYCRGTLAGETPDGRIFEGIRFIDRFVVAKGKLRRQEVWNDLAEAGVVKV